MKKKGRIVILKIKRFFKVLGPGVITGAADDDPSGIVTYAIAGAKGGFNLLWMAIVTFPLMAAIQEMCARIGMVTSSGLMGVMRRRYSKPLFFLLALLAIFANTVNIGADLLGMASATALLIPLSEKILALIFVVVIVPVIVLLPYKRLAKYLKWLTLALFAYIAAAFASSPDWREALRATFAPQFMFNKEIVLVMVAVLGTTISPYLFFWQASEEVEERETKNRFRFIHRIVTKHELKEMRDDVNLGMFFSNLVMFFIIVNTGAVFHSRGITELVTAGQVASSLEPLVGGFAYLLFTVGIIGTGLLAIPVLAGSTAYVLTEAFGLTEGLNKKFHEAKIFYGTIIASTLVGFLMSFLEFGAVEILFAAAVIYGMISPPIILIIMDIANNRAIMGNKVNNWFQNFFGAAAFLVTGSAALLMIFAFL
jgi:NRAMP (natural resistance-associated macrophage protein)-like metal ion transporter